MGLWDGTKTAVSEVGGDLQLDEGAGFGRYEQASTAIAGAVGRFNIETEFEWEESPASQGLGLITLDLNTSDDGAAWDGWKPFRPGEHLTRFYKFRANFTGCPAKAQRPKITRLEPVITQAYSEPKGIPVLDTINDPVAAPNVGEAWIVGTGVNAFLNHDKEIATCVETTGPTYHFEVPHEGKKVYHIADKEGKVFDDSSEWVSEDARKTAPHKQYIPGYATESEPAGTWTYVIDGLQDTNGYYENVTGGAPAALDNVTYNIGLKAGSYDLRLMSRTGPNQGIIKIYFDSTLVATFDLYSVGIVRNVISTQAAITVAVAKTVSVVFKVDGKNPASGNFHAYVSWIDIAPA